AASAAPDRQPAQALAHLPTKGGSGGLFPVDVNSEREVIHCALCGLVQYRTRAGNCRRCLRHIPVKVVDVAPVAPAPDWVEIRRQRYQKWPSLETVDNIGFRIQRLRESRALTQNQIQSLSRVSRSYLSRIESGSLTPSLATLEKLSSAIGVSLNDFFVPMT